MFAPGEFPPLSTRVETPSEYHATGTIRDSDGAVLAGARIKAHRKTDDVAVAEAVADDAGVFSLYFPRDGQTYYLKGYEPDGTTQASSTAATIVPRL